MIPFTHPDDHERAGLRDYYPKYVRRCGLRWLGVVLIVLALVCGVYALAFAQDDGFEFANGQPTSSIGRTVPEPIGTCGDVR